MSVHCLEHLYAGVIETDQREIIVEGGEPIFVLRVPIGNQIRDAPCKERECVSREVQRFLDGGEGFHRA
jgi:hypothetical protein